MKISTELLAAYAEGKVTKEERNQVRQYLAENPNELESVMMMMDNDYELMLDDDTEDAVVPCHKRNSLLNKNKGIPSGRIAAKVAKPMPYAELCYSAAAFAPKQSSKPIKMSEDCIKPKDSFSKRLDDLIDDLGI